MKVGLTAAGRIILHFGVALVLWCSGFMGAAAEADAQVRAPGQRVPQKIKERRADRLVEEGMALMHRGKYQAAVAKFEDALRLEPAHLRAHVQAGLAALQLDRPELAQHHAAAALRNAPEHARAHLVLGRALWQQGQLLAASDHLRKAQRLSAGNEDRDEAGRWLSRWQNDRVEWFQRVKARMGDTTRVAPPAVPQTPAPASQPALAVLPFAISSSAQVDSSLGQTLAEMLTTGLIKRRAYRVIERTQLDRLFAEQALGQSGVLEEETLMAVGDLVGAAIVIIGSLSQPRQILEADARILHVGTGQALAACSAQGASAGALRDMAESLATEISNMAGLIAQAVQRDSTPGQQK